MRARFLVLALLAAGCRPDFMAARELDRLEAELGVTAEQRPAWEAFRREAESAGERWAGPRAEWRRELRSAAAGPGFDAASARASADAAAERARRDAHRLIDAWSRLDRSLAPAQRAVLRRSLAD